MFRARFDMAKVWQSRQDYRGGEQRRALPLVAILIAVAVVAYLTRGGG